MLTNLVTWLSRSRLSRPQPRAASERPMSDRPHGTALHIGIAKTGTTYLQNWLQRHRAPLLERGVYVPTSPMHAHRLAVEFIIDEARRSRDDIQAILRTPLSEAVDQLKRMQDAAAHTIILSSEYFWLGKPHRMLPFFRDHGVPVQTVIAYVRRQDRLIEAGYNQEVKAMKLSAPLGDHRYINLYDWSELHATWSAGIPAAQIKLRNYDPLAATGGLLRDFLTQIDQGLRSQFSDDDFVDGDRANASLPADLLEFKRLLNAADLADMMPAFERAYRAQAKTLLSFRMSPERQRRCFEEYVRCNEMLADKFPGQSFEEYADFNAWNTSPGADLTHQLSAEWVVQLLKAVRAHESTGP